MKRSPRPDELRLWARVASTVRPSPGRAPVLAPTPSTAASTTPSETVVASGQRPGQRPVVAAKPAAPRAHSASPPQTIEPGRMRRLSRERDPIGPRLDLHGLSQDAARGELSAFLRRAAEDGWRAALVITGKGSRGDGVLRRAAPEWLAAAELRDIVAGVSAAHRRHGGDGALYVALKRRAPAQR